MYTPLISKSRVGAAPIRMGGRNAADEKAPRTDSRASQAPEAKREREEEGRGSSLLIVDDAEHNRELYADFFQFVGFAVEQAVDGEDALAKIAQSRPDVILMDLAMPRMDGCEATRRIRSDPSTESIPVIIITGHATPTELEHAWDSGADDVCLKPCLPEEVLRRIRRAIRTKT